MGIEVWLESEHIWVGDKVTILRESCDFAGQDGSHHKKALVHHITAFFIRPFIKHM